MLNQVVLIDRLAVAPDFVVDSEYLSETESTYDELDEVVGSAVEAILLKAAHALSVSLVGMNGIERSSTYDCILLLRDIADIAVEADPGRAYQAFEKLIEVAKSRLGMIWTLDRLLGIRDEIIHLLKQMDRYPARVAAECLQVCPTSSGLDAQGLYSYSHVILRVLEDLKRELFQRRFVRRPLPRPFTVPIRIPRMAPATLLPLRI